MNDDNGNDRVQVIISDYLEYRAQLRGFDVSTIEKIVRFSQEKYFDTVTGRMVAIGKHDTRLVIIPYETTGDTISPITIHVITRQQITFRLKNGRFVYE